jgi:hypothetical protein
MSQVNGFRGIRKKKWNLKTGDVKEGKFSNTVLTKYATKS